MYLGLNKTSNIISTARCWFPQVDASTTHTQSPAAGSQAELQTVNVSNDAHTAPSHQRRQLALQLFYTLLHFRDEAPHAWVGLPAHTNQ